MIDKGEILQAIQPHVLGWIGNWIYLQAPLTSTNFDGDSFSTTAKTLIDLSAEFGVPANVKAIYVNIQLRDSGSSGGGYFLILSPNDTANSGIVTRIPQMTNDAIFNAAFVVPCDANGDIYYQISASGASTMDVNVNIWGYCL